ncbi:MAG: histidine kinase [Sphingobacteriales bacterium]|nr:histidine kinase [Sphingobacteriales bacterium]
MKNQSIKRIILLSALFITLVINLPLLLASEESRLVEFIKFNSILFLFRVVLGFIFSYLGFLVLLRDILYPMLSFNYLNQLNKYIILFSLILIFSAIGIYFGYLINFKSNSLLPADGNLVRFTVASILIYLESEVLKVFEEGRRKEKENEKLKTSVLKAELTNLKQQLNPHFFFNALSTLSGVVSEDKSKALHFIHQLSKYFRATLNSQYQDLITLEEELKILKYYEDILKMRFEDAFELDINISSNQLQHKIPVMALQVLVENAVKHNKSSRNQPLKVKIKSFEGGIEISNPLNLNPFPEPSTGIGLSNLNDRFQILLAQPIEIKKTEDHFIVWLPIN